MKKVERVARAIAKAFGENFDDVPKHVNDWQDRVRTEKSFNRDINMPMQPDYMVMAEYAIKEMENAND